MSPKKSWFLMNNQCKNCLSFCIDFSSKIMTFSGSKSAWIFGWFFHWKWPPKVSHFQWKNHPKNKTFSEPLKNRFFGVLGALRDSARWPYSFFFRFFRFLVENVDLEAAPFPALWRPFFDLVLEPSAGVPPRPILMPFWTPVWSKLTPFWALLTSLMVFLSKSFKNGLQNHGTNIKIAKASSPNEDSNLHVND